MECNALFTYDMLSQQIQEPAKSNMDLALKRLSHYY